MNDDSASLTCSAEEIEQLNRLANSTTAGIWRVKRAKALLGVLEGISPARLMVRVRVPVVSILKCIRELRYRGMAYFDEPERSPTAREAAVEWMLAFLEKPLSAASGAWDTLSGRYIGLNFTARDIQTIRDMILAESHVTRQRIAEVVCTGLQLHDGCRRPRHAVMPLFWVSSQSLRKNGYHSSGLAWVMNNGVCLHVRFG